MTNAEAVAIANDAAMVRVIEDASAQLLAAQKMLRQKTLENAGAMSLDEAEAADQPTLAQEIKRLQGLVSRWIYNAATRIVGVQKQRDAFMRHHMGDVLAVRIELLQGVLTRKREAVAQWEYLVGQRFTVANEERPWRSLLAGTVEVVAVGVTREGKRFYEVRSVLKSGRRGQRKLFVFPNAEADSTRWYVSKWNL